MFHHVHCNLLQLINNSRPLTVISRFMRRDDISDQRCRVSSAAEAIPLVKRHHHLLRLASGPDLFRQASRDASPEEELPSFHAIALAVVVVSPQQAMHCNRVSHQVTKPNRTLALHHHLLAQHQRRGLSTCISCANENTTLSTPLAPILASPSKFPDISWHDDDAMCHLTMTIRVT